MTIHLKLDTATPLLEALHDRVQQPRQLNLAAAGSALPLYQRNFLRLSLTNRNPFGASNTFWNLMASGGRAVDGTVYEEPNYGADDVAGYIAMPRPVALRYFGGTVTPKTSKYLAIPARSEAYNKSPKDFTDLRLSIFTKPGGGKTFALAQKDMQKVVYRKGRARKDGTRGATGAPF